MESYNKALRTLCSHDKQPYHYHALLKQEALMRLCAKKAQNRLPMHLNETRSEPY